MSEQLKCECQTWAVIDLVGQMLGNGHHVNCKQFEPNVGAIRLIKKLVRGMAEWAGDEDGVHPAAWEAYKEGKFVADGKFIDDDFDTMSEYTRLTTDNQNLRLRVAELETALTFNLLRKTSAARSERWSKGNHADLNFAMMELAGEGDEQLAASLGVIMAIGRACNFAKKLARLQYGWAGGVDTTEHLAEELADVVICADLAAQRAGIDLETAIVKKFNAGSDKHGFPERLPDPSQKVGAS